jgi:hypothetical protein
MISLSWIAAAVLLPGLLAACSMAEQGNGPSLAPAKLPEYAVGDAFNFDDGRTEHVVSADGGVVHWSSSEDFAFATSPSVLLPRMEWDSSTEHGERRLDAAPTALWPLAVGNQAKIKARETVLFKATGRTSVTAEDWSCSVPDTAKIATKAGTFDAYRVVCRLETESLFVPYEQERTFYYAPAVRYYVRREDRYRGGDFSAIQLVDFRTADPKIPALLGQLRNTAIQQALETMLSGEQVSWQSERKDYKGTVEPLRTFRDKSGQYCRDYAETFDDGTRLYRVAATACRSRDGKWRALSK